MQNKYVVPSKTKKTKRNFTSFSRDSYHLYKLKEGIHNYSEEDIEIQPIQTVLQGLCYRLHFTNLLLESNLPYSNYLILYISTSLSGIDKLIKMNLFVVTSETWQGIIEKTWPYSKFPLALSGKFQSKVLNLNYAYIEENDWKFLEGKNDFDECMGDNQPQNCVSIFDPRPCKNR